VAWQPPSAGRRRIEPLLVTSVVLAAAAAGQTCVALDGGQAALPHHFGVVGSIAQDRTAIGHGFSGVQIAPMWVLTAAHVAPQPGAIYANEFGVSGVSEVLTFATRVPTISPVPGALRDDLALVHLSSPIRSPYFPRLADEDRRPHAQWPAAVATLVSNNPSLSQRRYGASPIELTPPVPVYGLALSVADDVRLVAGDSGSPMFMGHLADTDGSSVLIGIASAQASLPSGKHLGVYTRVGAYRHQLDRAVQVSGEHLRWTELAPTGR
jgi:secreted trypsin-like serine protease